MRLDLLLRSFPSTTSNGSSSNYQKLKFFISLKNVINDLIDSPFRLTSTWRQKMSLTGSVESHKRNPCLILMSLFFTLRAVRDSDDNRWKVIPRLRRDEFSVTVDKVNKSGIDINFYQFLSPNSIVRRRLFPLLRDSDEWKDELECSQCESAFNCAILFIVNTS